MDHRQRQEQGSAGLLTALLLVDWFYEDIGVQTGTVLAVVRCPVRPIGREAGL
mgnify:CR=1 FL=1